MNGILTRARAYVKQKYTATADARQKEMGISYVTAEVDDLAREFARFAAAEIKAINDRTGIETMSCCASAEYRKEEIDGKCPVCEEPTVDGKAFEKCDCSPVICKTCGHAPCDGSC